MLYIICLLLVFVLDSDSVIEDIQTARNDDVQQRVYIEQIIFLTFKITCCFLTLVIRASQSS